jgi:hypothetical protein
LGRAEGKKKEKGESKELGWAENKEGKGNVFEI